MGLSIIKIKSRQFTVVAVAALLLLSGMLFGPMSQSASAVSCHQRDYAPHYNFTYWENGVAYNSADWYSRTVTIGSPCTAIVVGNIIGGSGPGGHCWTFKVFFPDYGSWSPLTDACVGPGEVKVLYQGVGDGTRYSVYHIENQNLRYTIYD